MYPNFHEFKASSKFVIFDLPRIIYSIPFLLSGNSKLLLYKNTFFEFWAKILFNSLWSKAIISTCSITSSFITPFNSSNLVFLTSSSS